ncbi:BTB/POZ domain-containing protein [Carex littledalei]|uniref:BTB/POZ domain-containing protein n=1 Tax=Carex littledalei TaxID=544730 RepID=A0A833QWH1_9POAL|nr:BTB/POZ domain-containing protein [Carex littledalei]
MAFEASIISLDADRKRMSYLHPEVMIEVEDVIFHLHKIPLITRSPILRNLIHAHSTEESDTCAFALHGFPGGAHSFELVVKFCYGRKIELTSVNVVPLLCAAFYLHMTEKFSKDNLIAETEIFFSNKVLPSGTESIQALLSCEEVFIQAEELGFISRCLDSVAKYMMKNTELIYPQHDLLWSEIRCMSPTHLELTQSSLCWWFDDLCSLSLDLFRRLISVMEEKGHDPLFIFNVIMYYARKYNPGLDPDSTGIWSIEERFVLEQIVFMLPAKKGVTSTNFLLSMLSAGTMLSVSPACIHIIERRIGAQLDESTLEDLLIPIFGDTTYNTEVIKSIIENFVKENSHVEKVPSNTAIAKLLDRYLAYVAADASLNMEMFMSLAAVVPRNARPCHDDLYRAINSFMEYHPWLSEEEKIKLCQVLDIKMMSEDACNDASENGELPFLFKLKVHFNRFLHFRRSLARDGAK